MGNLGYVPVEYRERNPAHIWIFNPWTGELRPEDCVTDDPYGYGIAPPQRPVVTVYKTAPQFLAKAAELMLERGKQYDAPAGERSMGKAVAAFNAITGKSMTESDGWLLMLCLKKVRLFQHPGFHQDSAEDAVAYSALLAESKQKERAV